MQQALVRVDLATRPQPYPGGQSEEEILRGLCGRSLLIRNSSGTAHQIIIEAHLPDFDTTDVTVDVGEGLLLIQAERYEEDEDAPYVVHGSSSFYRSIEIPADCEPTLIAADFTGGLLRISIPVKTKVPARETLTRRALRENTTPV